MDNEELKNEEVQETGIATVQGLGALGKRTSTKSEIFTNITDNKRLFNLENHVDCLLNDCENEMIRVKEVLIKRYEKPMKEPVIDEETGEILKDKEFTMACILIDDNGKHPKDPTKIMIMITEKSNTEKGFFSEAIKIGDEEPTTPEEGSEGETDTNSEENSDGEEENATTKAVRDKVAEMDDIEDPIDEEPETDGANNNGKVDILKKISNMTKSLEDVKKSIIDTMK